MLTTVADYLIQQLNKLGIEEIFGLPGDFNFEIVEAIEKNKNVNWIGSTNELNASYAADGYARIKGYGAVVTTFGVGELSAINGIAGSMAENLPVIKIAGIPATKYIKNNTRLHHNLFDVNYRVFESAYSNVVQTTAFLDEKNAKSEIDRIINTMVQTKRPVYVAIPMDIALSKIDNKGEITKPVSDSKTLNKAVDDIILEIEKAKKPIVLTDILAKRFEAREYVNLFLEKTKIPSCAFPRGIDVIKNSIENYLGVYVGHSDNKICYDYINSSDCIIAFGAAISDLNTFSFDFKFNLDKHIDIQPNFVSIRGKKYKNILIKDVVELLVQKINYISKEKLKREYVYSKAKIEQVELLNSDYIYPRLNEFLRNDDIFITEVGLAPLGSLAMKLPDKINVQNQMMWGSIGWATPCSEGCCFAAKNKRVVLITGDGSHQLTAQEISTMLRNNLKPVIFVLNNKGYTIERLLCDDIHYKYNDIADWDYSKLPCVFKGDCFIAKVRTNKEFDEILHVVEKEQKNRMCYIELMLDYLDMPKLALAIAKHPQKFIK